MGGIRVVPTVTGGAGGFIGRRKSSALLAGRGERGPPVADLRASRPAVAFVVRRTCAKPDIRRAGPSRPGGPIVESPPWPPSPPWLASVQDRSAPTGSKPVEAPPGCSSLAGEERGRGTSCRLTNAGRRRGQGAPGEVIPTRTRAPPAHPDGATKGRRREMGCSALRPKTAYGEITGAALRSPHVFGPGWAEGTASSPVAGGAPARDGGRVFFCGPGSAGRQHAP